MSVIRILGIVILISGIGMLLGAYYIKDQVAKGKIEISEGQKKINQTKEVFSLSPYTKGIGQGVASSGQHKIEEGQTQIEKYTKLANQLQVGGIVAVVAGFVLIILGRKKHRR